MRIGGLDTTRAGGAGSRGQTNLDFVLGVTVLLVSVVFVWLFLPNVFAPFTANGAADGLTAERAANSLAEDTLSPNAGSAGLDEDCVVAFFGGPTSDEGCSFDASNSIQRRLGLHEYQPMNVTVENADGGVLQWNNSGAGGFSASGPGPKMAVGSEHGSTNDVSVARRIVSIDGQRAVLVVRLW